ncbi:DNA double-strand break repair nuclease NurA [archaeon]
MAVEDLIRHLGAKYDESKLVPPTTMRSAESREYRLYPLGADSFVNYEPTKLAKKFKVLAVDSGSTALFDTPYWGIGMLKLKARLIEFDPATKRGDTVKQDSSERFCLFLEDEGDGDGVVNREFWEKGNYLKREEMSFVREQLAKGWLDDEDLLLIDGALSIQTAYEKAIVKAHRNVVGISKRSGLRINRYSASSYLMTQAVEHSRAAKPWFCHPLVKEYPGNDPVAEIMFAAFTPNSRYAFRVDFPFEITALNPSEQSEKIAGELSKIALFSFDPKYRGYPYPLGAVHTDSVTRPIDRDRARVFVQQKLDDADLPGGAYDLIKKDIENEYWYDKFRKRSNK